MLSENTSNTIPSHVAVILDGNRRWHSKEGESIQKGYAMGAEKLEEFLDWSVGAGVKTVSAYILSTENLIRSKKELSKLFDVMCEYGEKWLQPGGLIDKYEIKINFIGKLNGLPLKLVKIIKKMKTKASKYSKRFLNILINYSGKEEIADAMRNIVMKMAKHAIRITPKTIEKNLSVKKPVDLLIRTGGNHRLSNFLLWQTAYAEMYVTKTLWPDFSKKDFTKALQFFSQTRRNFGK